MGFSYHGIQEHIQTHASNTCPNGAVLSRLSHTHTHNMQMTIVLHIQTVFCAAAALRGRRSLLHRDWMARASLLACWCSLLAPVRGHLVARRAIVTAGAASLIALPPHRWVAHALDVTLPSRWRWRAPNVRLRRVSTKSLTTLERCWTQSLSHEMPKAHPRCGCHHRSVESDCRASRRARPRESK